MRDRGDHDREDEPELSPRRHANTVRGQSPRAQEPASTRRVGAQRPTSTLTPVLCTGEDASEKEPPSTRDPGAARSFVGRRGVPGPSGPGEGCGPTINRSGWA
ncbi:hypothetical protein KTU01_34970 [Kocuria turfanensis]|uniref:Uncharacterized protein n=1 Tax=Kocuria turfanensis TaxID=388357 RepID=A0A512II40_9MICC|nr:hypothetical protein KTU01_34970 [Kocuria turfanensis]